MLEQLNDPDNTNVNTEESADVMTEKVGKEQEDGEQWEDAKENNEVEKKDVQIKRVETTSTTDEDEKQAEVKDDDDQYNNTDEDGVLCKPRETIILEDSPENSQFSNESEVDKTIAKPDLELTEGLKYCLS